VLIALGVLMVGEAIAFSQQINASPFSDSATSPWKAGICQGFLKGTKEWDLFVGPGMGIRTLGSRHNHDWGLGIMDFGWVFTDVVGLDHWYRGNWELVAETFGGVQFHPNAAYLVGLGPHLRYNFAPGHRWIPFLDLGAGGTLTDIQSGDLSTTFEFNLNAAVGAHYFLRDDLGLSFECRFTHLSNAGLDYPNLGVNTVTFLFGLSFYF
jgi:hypothetical protein